MTHPSQVRRSLSASRVLRKAVWHSEVMDSILGSGDCVCVCVFLSMWAGMSMQLQMGVFCVHVFLCVFDRLQEW